MGTCGGLVVACNIGCGAREVGIRVGACTIYFGSGKGYGVSVSFGGRGVGAGLGAGPVVARRRICAICM